MVPRTTPSMEWVLLASTVLLLSIPSQCLATTPIALQMRLSRRRENSPAGAKNADVFTTLFHKQLAQQTVIKVLALQSKNQTTRERVLLGLDSLKLGLAAPILNLAFRGQLHDQNDPETATHIEDIQVANQPLVTSIGVSCLDVLVKLTRDFVRNLAAAKAAANSYHVLSRTLGEGRSEVAALSGITNYYLIYEIATENHVLQHVAIGVPLIQKELTKHFPLNGDETENVRQALNRLQKVALRQRQPTTAVSDPSFIAASGNLNTKIKDVANATEYAIRVQREKYNRKNYFKSPSADILHAQATVFDSPIRDYMFEGDILLTPDQANAILRDAVADQPFTRKRAALTSFESARWPKGTPIPYTFHNALTESERADITAAINFWQAHTCLQFVYQQDVVDTTKDVLQFYRGYGCYSMIGRVGGEQGVSIGNGCQWLGIVTHEIGHALGFWHEQSRPDADRYVRILEENVIPDHLSNFLRRPWKDVNLYSLPYDYGSVMHYGPQAFVSDWSKLSVVTLQPGYQAVIGQIEAPSFYDVKIVNEAYCADSCKDIKLNCLYGGYADPNDCTQCTCPNGFGGRQCEVPAKSLNANCGGVVSASEDWAVLQSPGFPDTPYQANIQCNWLIRAPTGSHIVLEFVERFGLRCSVTCEDYVEVKNNSDFGNTGMRFCCYELPAGEFRSESSEMMVLLRTAIGADAGFKARFRQSTGGSGIDGVETTSATTETTTTEMTDITTTTGTTEITTTETATTESTMTTTEIASTTATLTETPTTVSELPIEFTTTTLSTTVATTTEATTSSPILATTATTPKTETTAVGTTTTNPPSLLSKWSDWSDCSQSCGACGVKLRYRRCLKFSPDCSGVQQEVRRCGFDPCGAKKGPPDSCTLETNNDFACAPEGSATTKLRLCSQAQDFWWKCALPYCCRPFIPKDGQCVATSESILRTAADDNGPGANSYPVVSMALWSGWSSWSKCSLSGRSSCENGSGCGRQTRKRVCVGDTHGGFNSCRGPKIGRRYCSNCRRCPPSAGAPDDQANQFGNNGVPPDKLQ